MKMLCAGIRSIINVKGKKFFNISQIVNNSEIVQNPKEIAWIFNNYLVKVAGKVNSEIPRPRKSPLDCVRRKLDASFFHSRTDSSEIECIISQLKNGKAVGPYSIPRNLLKMLSPHISTILTILINESFHTGVLSDKLKNIAKVITLYKKDADDNPSNYRPISLLSIFGKILKKNNAQKALKFSRSK